ncbi:hypothetical protein [Acinetobacter pollinis]|uniref:Uncharacterized protein n=1 Tax=Acinetobacter pollinis TaxID=2605270 RepID=A0ABU6DQE0_9GAMM|nr:hypothetical protein [Acinetobacter pollinis]MBF7689349.1 hypothetical protein [Acinetobacter pollinis]MBF7691996.1 hypothetical protein [Acinetobacter pollinis]MBF7697056.1 hypothetical protein [Acinetobacter pollinis]MBF7700447.1 hypothetical protein [Acinetobacter pollinis]MEB5476060.1 hypothetical protein [Acinetobacter pollinis]
MKPWIKLESCNKNDLPQTTQVISDEAGHTFKCKFKEYTKIVNFEYPRLLRKITHQNFGVKILQEQELDQETWLFKATESDLIDWFNWQCCDIRKGGYDHFILLTDTEVWQILSLEDPTITLQQ